MSAARVVDRYAAQVLEGETPTAAGLALAAKIAAALSRRAATRG